MALPNPKDIKKLAEVCRKAGIIHFKSADFEFTLDPNSQPIVVNQAQKQTAYGPDPTFETDTLTDAQLLGWNNLDEETA